MIVETLIGSPSKSWYGTVWSLGMIFMIGTSQFSLLKIKSNSGIRPKNFTKIQN